MRIYTLCIAICFLYVSCKKQIQDVVIVTPVSSSTYDIKIDQIINDSTVVLKWSIPPKDFKKYRLVRTATYLKNGKFGRYSDPIDSSTNLDHLSFTDNSMPLARDIYYDLYVSSDLSSSYDQGLYEKARVYYQRPNSLVYGVPIDVLIDKQQKWLYVIENYTVSIVNYTTGRIVTSKEFPTTISYSALGEFNGSRELYVPENDGWLLILDATTLQQKDKIYVAGIKTTSVLAVNGKLYVSSSDLSAGAIYNNCLKVYDRATKNLVGRAGYWDQTRLLLLEGSSVEMIDLTLHLAPVGLSYYQFSSDGVPITEKQEPYSDYRKNADIVRSFPDGSKFITSSSGTIYNKSLTFDRYVKQYGNYSDFAFNTDGSTIYAADPGQKKIDVIAYPSTTYISSYTTAFYPYKIFRDGNSLICVSKDANQGGYQPFNYLFFEQINL